MSPSSPPLLLLTFTLLEANTPLPPHRARLQPHPFPTPPSLLLQLIAFRFMQSVDLDVDVDLLAQGGESSRLLRGESASAGGEGGLPRREMTDLDPEMGDSSYL